MMLPLNQILCQDALTGIKTLPAQSVQAVIADPPYYNVLTHTAWDTQWNSEEDWLRWSRSWVAACMQVLKSDGLLFCFGQHGKREHAFLHLMSQLCSQFAFHDLLVWDRAVGYNERRDSFTPAYEMILVLKHSPEQSPKFFKDAVRETYDEQTIARYARDPRYKDKTARMHHLRQGKYATNILRIPSLKGASKEKCGHPSQKPLELLSRLVRCCTEAGDVVLDPFLGSGSTALAAQQHGRRWIGIENNPVYVQMAQQRLKNHAPAAITTTQPRSA